MKKIFTALLVFFLASQVIANESNSTTVTIDNFPRAESDTMFRGTLKTMNKLFKTKLGELGHMRTPTPLENQPVIRMNRDTLYSAAVFDLSKPVTITLADVGGRYQSMHVVSQDHYMYAESKPGTYTLTQEKVGSRYAQVSIRTFVNADDPEDIKLANKAQDTIRVEGAIVGGAYEAPDWNQEQLTKIRQLLSQLSLFGLDAGKAFGKKGEVDPVHYLVGAGAGWGGLPKEEAIYELSQAKENDGTPHKMTFEDVPVNAFWSVTVYNKEGYIEKNDLGAYSFNDKTAKKNSDGSITIHFGGCEDKRVNCLPIKAGWNYAIRYYQPKEALLSGKWKSPEIIPVITPPMNNLNF